MKNIKDNLNNCNKKPKHGMRKLKVGYVSCLLGAVLVFGQVVPSFTVAGIKVNNNIVYAQKTAKDAAIDEVKVVAKKAKESIDNMKNLSNEEIQKAKKTIEDLLKSGEANINKAEDNKIDAVKDEAILKIGIEEAKAEIKDYAEGKKKDLEAMKGIAEDKKTAAKKEIDDFLKQELSYMDTIDSSNNIAENIERIKSGIDSKVPEKVKNPLEEEITKAKDELKDSYDKIFKALNKDTDYAGIADKKDGILKELSDKLNKYNDLISNSKNSDEIKTNKENGLVEIQKELGKADLLKLAADKKSEIGEISEANQDDATYANQAIDALVKEELAKIDNAKSQTELNGSMTKARDAITNKGNLEKAKVEAKAEVEKAAEEQKKELENLKKDHNNSFTDEQIENAINQVEGLLVSEKANIDLAKTQEAAREVGEKAVKDIKNTKPMTDEEAKKLQAAQKKAFSELEKERKLKQAEIDKITDTAAKKKAEEELKKIHDKALNDILQARSEKEVSDVLESGVKEIKNIETPDKNLDKAKEEAKGKLKEAADNKKSEIEKMKDTAAKQKANELLTSKHNTALGNIDKANSEDEVSKALKSWVEEINKIDTKETPDKDLDKAKEEAKKELKTVADNKKSEIDRLNKLSKAEKTEMKKVVDKNLDDALFFVESANTIDKINKEKEKGISSIVNLYGYSHKNEKHENNSSFGGIWFAPKKPKKIEEKVEKMTMKEQKPYIFGYEDGTIKADKSVTRAEAVTMIATLMNYDLNDTSNTKYKDANSWYNKFINSAYKAGILLEKSGEDFRPNDGITRGELVAILANIDPTNDAKAPFSDISGHKYEKAINQAFGNKRINGYKDNTFKPDQVITRAEIATILNNMFNRVYDKNNDEMFLSKFKDIDRTHWAFKELVKASISTNLSNNK